MIHVDALRTMLNDKGQIIEDMQGHKHLQDKLEAKALK